VGEYCDIAVSGRKEGRPELNALMKAARNRELDCVLVWRFDRFARSTQHLLGALEEFKHLSVRFISVQDQIDTDSPMGKAMFTIISAMAELESALISERVTAGMRAAKNRGKLLGRPKVRPALVSEIENLASSTTLSVRQIHKSISEKASRGFIGKLTKRVRTSDQLL
jgi:DNA invertase Pin-like site-specific DNA recombinase